MAVMKCVTESGLSCRLRQSLFFVKLQTFTVNGSDRVCDGICFYKVQTFIINVSDKSSMESVLVKFQVIAMYSNARVCGRFCGRFWF